MKRTPELAFAADPAVRAGARIESLLAEGSRPETDNSES
jgi:ribosome-binding factor A